MEPYSMDLRQRVLAAYDEQAMETREVAETYGVSPAWARRLKQRRRELGSIEPLPGGHGPPPKLSDADRATLAALVAKTPDATLAELRDALAAACGTRVGVSTVHRVLDALGLTRKKSRRAPASRTGPT